MLLLTILKIEGIVRCKVWVIQIMREMLFLFRSCHFAQTQELSIASKESSVLGAELKNGDETCELMTCCGCA